jgi:hypothetical protein
MNWGVTGLLILFGAFVLLLIINPNLSCFGRRLKSPFYPLWRKKKLAQEEKARKARLIKTDDYGFKLGDDGAPPPPGPSTQAKKKTEDYGFKLDP